MPRGRKTSRATCRKAAAPEKPEEPEIHEKQIPRNIPPGSPTEASKKFEGIEPDSEHGEKDTDSDEDPVTQSQAHTISSDSQSVQVDSSAGSQKSKESSKLPEDDSAQTSPASKKNNKSASQNRDRQDYKKAMKDDPQIEKELVEFFKSNPCLWDLRQEAHHNRDIKKKLLEDISKTTRVSVHNIQGWWRGSRDTYTRLSQKKSGEERDNLPFKQKWVLDNFAFLRERPAQKRAPIKSLQQLAEDNPLDLDAVEREAAIQGKANDGSTGKGACNGKSKKKKSGDAVEDADILALQQTAKDSVSVLESLKESINNVAVKRDEPSDVATLYGQYVTQEMRQMSKRRFKLFRREVEASLTKYISSTDSEDDDFIPLSKKRSTVTSTDTFSSSSVASTSYGASSSYYPPGMQQSGGDVWQPPPSSWIPNPPQAASPWHSQDNIYMQQYVQQQRMPAVQKQPTLQSPNRPPLRHVAYGQPVQGQTDVSPGSLRPLYAVPATHVTSVASPVTRGLLSSGIDGSTLQGNFTQEAVNMSVITSNVDVLGQEGFMDSSLRGTSRPLSAPVMLSASDVSSNSRVITPRSQ